MENLHIHWKRFGLPLALTLALAFTAGCRSGGRTAPAAEESAAPTEAEVPASVPMAGDIVLLFAGSQDDLLHAEKRSVVPIASPEDRAKQCLEELFRGSNAGLLATIPAGVRVREVYILADGTAYADLSGELMKGAAAAGGSQRELMIVYSIVDTLALNVGGLKQIGILVDGTAQETLAGHVFTGRPLTPDFQYVETGAWPAKPAAAPGAAPGTAPGTGDGQGTASGAAEPPGPPDAGGDGTAPSGGSGKDGDSTSDTPKPPPPAPPSGDPA